MGEAFTFSALKTGDAAGVSAIVVSHAGLENVIFIDCIAGFCFKVSCRELVLETKLHSLMLIYNYCEILLLRKLAFLTSILESFL